MKNIINNKVLASVVMVLALVFVAMAGAPAAHAQYYSYYPSVGYSYQYGGTYAYSPTYYVPQIVYAPLRVSCYPTSSNANIGNAVTWTSSVSGGNGLYSYSWSGSGGLAGYGSTVSMAYYSSGIQTASLTVYSNGQSQTAYCSGSVNVYNPVTYYAPTAYYTSQSYYPASYQSLAAYCSPSTASVPVGSPVLWTANATGGNGSYDYSWSGTDGIAGYNQTLSYAYNTPGQKTASVTVSSGGQVITELCNGSVNVGAYQIVSAPAVSSSNNSGLDIGCYADPATASVDQPVTWNVEVTGGVAPYAYSWTGSDGLTGTQSSIIKYYDSSGSKSAIVSVTSGNGLSGTRACTNAVAVRSASSGYAAPAQAAPAQAQPAAQPANVLPAAALFSLNNIPWGWVAILIILVLFGTVVYLLFNRQKI